MFFHVLLVVWKRITIFAQDYEKDYQFMDDSVVVADRMQQG
jgi:hypothetical protein